MWISIVNGGEWNPKPHDWANIGSAISDNSSFWGFAMPFAIKIRLMILFRSYLNLIPNILLWILFYQKSTRNFNLSWLCPPSNSFPPNYSAFGIFWIGERDVRKQYKSSPFYSALVSRPLSFPNSSNWPCHQWFCRIL